MRKPARIGNSLTRFPGSPNELGFSSGQSMNKNYSVDIGKPKDPMHRVKILKKPNHEQKYIGVISWSNISSTDTLLCSEVELIMSNTLEMPQYFKRFCQILDENPYQEFQTLYKDQTADQIKLKCYEIVKILKDPKYKFTKVEDFPHILDERDFSQNTELFLTATALYKMGFMTKDEIKGSLDLFEQHRALTKTRGIKISDPFYLKQLIKGMRAMNKVMSPWFIRDWCLKCFKYLKITSIMVFNNSLAIGRSPSKVKL